MSRVIPDWSAERISFQLQHPSIRLTVVVLEAAAGPPRLPRTEGCYVLIAVPQQTAYVGTTGRLSRRVRESRIMNLRRATHAVLIEPIGMPWTRDERSELERRLIAGLAGADNWQRGVAAPGTASRYLDEVALNALSLIGLWLVRPSAPRRPGQAPSQANTARDIVLDERRHPLTVEELICRLRDLGWSARGATPHKTLRRDLRCATRGGTVVIRVTGSWSDGATLIYVAGRRYTSGWTPPTAHNGQG